MAAIPDTFEIPEKTYLDWQETVDLMSELAGIPASLIMRVSGPNIEVCVASKGEENPYTPGDKEHLENSGLYCETVLRTRKPLLIPNALKDPNWNNNPDIKLDMIAYLGYPLMLPNGTPFGTLCLLDRKENAFTPAVERLVRKFQQYIQSHLELLYMNTVLDAECQRLSEYVDTLQHLRGIIPICARCKSIRDDKGYWQEVEHFIAKHPKAEFTHGYCPNCLEKTRAEITH